MYTIQILEEDVSEEILFHASFGLDSTKDPSEFISTRKLEICYPGAAGAYAKSVGAM
jgi:hypothetical protein